MKNTFFFVLSLFLYITIIDIALTSLIQKNILKEKVDKEYMKVFLFVNNSQKYCEKDNLILAYNSDKLYNLNKVLNFCESKKNCDFISYRPKRILRNSIYYKDEEPLKNTGANWICKGDTWIYSHQKKDWITAIKEEHIRNHMKNFDSIFLNMTGECQKENIIMKITKFITPKEAAQECKRIMNCKFIILNYNKQLGSKSLNDDKAIFCSHTPINRISKLGFMIAGKNSSNIIHYTNNIKEMNTGIINTGMGGTITPDDYYYNYNKGDIVHASQKEHI
ncbi:conserved Plasmodium protein, unknown function [Plasmodium sp. gorilla clade G3]|nr:conserved Plasmodium protein, unknown function [Plasmodium sp. gorilla clade G3]